MNLNNLPASGSMGVTVADGVGTLKVYSESASEIWVSVLDSTDTSEVIKELPLTRGENHIWSVSSDLLRVGTKYALRADGPEGPRHRFNPNLRLIDPYAKAVIRESARNYHCEVLDETFDWDGVAKPMIDTSDLVIYEAHARGLTRANDSLPDHLRGTYAALGHPSTIDHLKRIGVTSVELLPIQQFISEPRLMNMGLINYWGYNTINFFTPHHRYASSAAIAAGPTAIANELKTAIRELHRNGIEVFLDVVYNHTAEGGGGGLTYSYRGLDNSSYYRQDDNGHFHDTTGCGNSLNFGNPHVVHLVLESLRYWSTEYQIDGFRFDLAATLARDENNHFDPQHPLLRAIVEDETLNAAKMIAEPWDVGLGGWQTGNFPDRFSEWNDRYRDSIRRFWLSDIAAARSGGNHWNGVADLATRVSGSRDIVDGPSGPLGGVNFITAHDGFTLADLVSFDVKHNQANGESNRDGTNGNHSFNHGHEGKDAPEEIKATRRRAARNLMATMLFSAGIPMVTAGDERLKSQNGNNNAYCQDNVISWVNWELDVHQRNFEETFAFLTRLRRDNPALRPSVFGDFNEATAEHDMVKWYNSLGEIMSEEDWHNSENRSVQRYTEHLNANGTRNALLTIFHGVEKDIELILPKTPAAKSMTLLWNSADERPASVAETSLPGSRVYVAASSVQLLRVNLAD